jgi:hypothetical protein
LAFFPAAFLFFFGAVFLIGLLLGVFAFLTFGTLAFGALVFLAGDLAGEEAATGAGTVAATTTGATFAGFATFALGFLGALVAFGFDAGFLDTDLFCAFAIFYYYMEKISNFYNL